MSSKAKKQKLICQLIMSLQRLSRMAYNPAVYAVSNYCVYGFLIRKMVAIYKMSETQLRLSIEEELLYKVSKNSALDFEVKSFNYNGKDYPLIKNRSFGIFTIIVRLINRKW